MPTVIDVPPTDPRVAALLDAQEAELTALYDGDPTQSEPFDPRTLAGEGSVLLAVQHGPELIACGALRRWDAHTAEVKRMYTRQGDRGNGHARRILHALIDRARRLGYARLVLETGDRQPDAIALYERSGFVRIPNYGYYATIESSVCYELPLADEQTG
ncbi:MULTISPECIES: GNAT family N-acetyltransferase [Deinococcus]|uniref:GNAT family N-acetyltransferase n=1 Tax=Deinococcus rufus TaxID=2136097 RepID=A0ABV7ZGG1_9DEIO|nr:GNAT family N-acetyltransferase [Deinococcus sp. AB2017081]WQE93667.1 GNAT family N-acetyltransferase [Deinococcus sp. AB2017081]